MAVTSADFDHVEDDRLRRIVSYWLASRNGLLMPTVDAIDPLEIRYALGIVWMCDVENAPRDFRYRLVGEHIRVTSKQSMTGRTLRELTDRNSIDRVLGYFNRAVDMPAVVHVAGRIYAEVKDPAAGERILLPFADPGTGRAVRILGATVHNWVERGVQFAEPPRRQVRTFTPADGQPSWCENWL